MLAMFDIEDTLIVSEDTPIIHKFETISRILAELKPDRIGLFSFIFYTDDDVNKANHLIRLFEDAFNISIDRSLIPTKQSIYESIRSSGKETFISKRSFSFMDFCELWSKDRAFIDWCRIHGSGDVVLVDDMVCDCELRFPECNIRMIKV